MDTSVCSKILEEALNTYLGRFKEASQPTTPASRENATGLPGPAGKGDCSCNWLAGRMPQAAGSLLAII